MCVYACVYLYKHMADDTHTQTQTNVINIHNYTVNNK